MGGGSTGCLGNKAGDGGGDGPGASNGSDGRGSGRGCGVLDLTKGIRGNLFTPVTVPEPVEAN